MRGLAGSCLGIAVLAFSATVLASQADLDITPDHRIRLLPPDAGETNGWTQAAEPALYEGEELYDYIDGGAEIFLERGFQRVIMQEYAKAGHTIVLDIYEMDSNANAADIFTLRAAPGDQAVPLGDGGRLTDYYLIFHRGPYFVSITGLDNDPAVVQGIQSIAAAVDSRITTRVDTSD